MTISSFSQIHVVHYNSKYANLTEAASKADGLAVLGGFIGVSLLTKTFPAVKFSKQQNVV